MGITELKLRCHGCDCTPWEMLEEIISLPLLDLEAAYIPWFVAPSASNSTTFFSLHFLLSLIRSFTPCLPHPLMQTLVRTLGSHIPSRILFLSHEP